MDVANDKLSIKNLLFTKAIPNHVISDPVDGHKIFSCTDCGDKFIFESSFHDHVNRQSMKITYMCRHCNQTRTFFNRCNLLFHIRSHVFKTATINVTDLKIEPLPLSNFMILPTPPRTTPTKIVDVATPQGNSSQNATVCLECKVVLDNTGIAYKDRADHYMQYSNEVYSCPICLFALPTTCAVRTHLRLHLKCPPYYCPECGSHLLAHKHIHYPYNHDCEGFKMMRATARLACSIRECRVFHPNDYKSHVKEYHMKKVYKCPYCVVACFNEGSMQSHLKTHQTDTKALVFYKCEMCPGKFVLQSRMESHLKSHKLTCVYPCWPCGVVFKDLSILLKHFMENHNKNETMANILNSILNENDLSEKNSKKLKRIYRVVKRCDQCRRSFTYRCQYDEIHNLPNECPYKCSSTFECSGEFDVMNEKNNTCITCWICKATVSQDWNAIKKHYASLHKSHKCLDAKIVLKRLDVSKYISQQNILGTKNDSIKTTDRKISRRIQRRRYNRNSVADHVPLDTQTSERQASGKQYVCNICGDGFKQKPLLEKHMVSHRDPCMAYQCMECGQSFVVKPTFSKHMLLEHDISDVEKYIKEKNCYNVNALIKYQSSEVISNEPLRENQCTICREDFEGPEELAKHFRVHGMAFLMKNNSNKSE
ncbi:zinc finger protein 532 [Helicoverpa armigera]|uniref:zinc finger protein 532 n=1 Tax=Helicoverpa armigera TaxID=29058 RepID=UPI003083468A